MDFTQSVRKELRAWLASQLTSTFSDTVVFERWPVAGRPLPPHAVSVLTVGEPELMAHQPKVHATAITATPLGTVTYSYGRCDLGMQVDVWCTTAADRYLLTRAVSDALNTHPIYSLPIAGALPELHRHPGVARYLTDVYNEVCSYEFDQVVSPSEDSDAAQTEEWRATFVGTARLYVTTRETIALLVQATTTWQVNGGSETRTDP